VVTGHTRPADGRDLTERAIAKQSHAISSLHACVPGLPGHTDGVFAVAVVTIGFIDASGAAKTIHADFVDAIAVGGALRLDRDDLSAPTVQTRPRLALVALFAGSVESTR
jgi:hypothetical protein